MQRCSDDANYLLPGKVNFCSIGPDVALVVHAVDRLVRHLLGEEKFAEVIAPEGMRVTVYTIKHDCHETFLNEVSQYVRASPLFAESVDVDEIRRCLAALRDCCDRSLKHRAKRRLMVAFSPVWDVVASSADSFTQFFLQLAPPPLWNGCIVDLLRVARRPSNRGCDRRERDGERTEMASGTSSRSSAAVCIRRKRRSTTLVDGDDDWTVDMTDAMINKRLADLGIDLTVVDIMASGSL
jgi:hypothetical protein